MSQTSSLQPQQPHFTHPEFPQVLHHLALPLQPLISMTTGEPCPVFPTSIIKYHLLSSSEFGILARHYHQTTSPSYFTSRYPRQVPSWEGNKIDMDTKRRRFGRFIGMRGCETPTIIALGVVEGQESLETRMEREWEETIRKSRGGDAEEALRRKAMGY